MSVGVVVVAVVGLVLLAVAIYGMWLNWRDGHS